MGISGGGAMYTPAISPHDPSLILLSCDMSCAFRSTDGGQTWEMIHHSYLLANTRCRPVFHPTDPDVIYAAHGWEGGLRVSRDWGQTWAPLGRESPSGLVALTVDPGNGDFLLGAGWDGVHRSLDGGLHWEKASGLTGEVVGFHIDQTSPREQRRCFAGADTGVFVSEDAGMSWGQIGEGLPPKPMYEFAGASDSRGDACVLYCTLRGEVVDAEYVGGVYRSTDRGRTWQQMMGPGIDVKERERWGRKRAPQYTYVLMSDRRPLTVYAVRGRPSQVFRSDDGGENWRPVLFTRMDSDEVNLEPNYLMAELGGSESNASGAGINPADPDMVMTTDWMCAQITRDGGKTWDTLHTRRAEGQGAAAQGQRWVNTGLTVTSVWFYYIDPFESNRHYIAYTDIKFARSEDGGKTWYSQWDRPLRNTTYELAFDPEVPGKIWAAIADVHDIPNANIILGRHWSRGGGGVGVSEDFGVTWRDTSAGLPESCVISVVLDPKSPRDARVLYASVWEHGVYKSVDSGHTWARKSEGLGAPDQNMRACRLILHPDGKLFCVVTGLREDDRFRLKGPGLYRSRDGGDTWEWINESQPLFWPKDFDVDPRDSDVIYLGAADAGRRGEGGLYKTTDGGGTWERVAREGPECFGATVDPKRPDWVYMCLTEGNPGPGLWLSKDAGKSWKPYEGLPFRNVQRVAFDPDDDSIIYVCTFGGSVWKGPADPEDE
jgi:photosystem II stability/assembly factor-like uncharacterized protein